MKTNLQDIYVDHLFKASSNRQDLILIFIKILKIFIGKNKTKTKNIESNFKYMYSKKNSLPYHKNCTDIPVLRLKS